MPKTLLLADDSVTIQKVVGITFANEDVELITVDNGTDALAKAKQILPDLVLADIGMPGMDGYELCSAIRRSPELAHVPVLLLTGTFESYDEQRAQAAGASGHISKPFEAQALVDRVWALLAEAEASQGSTRVADPLDLAPSAPGPMPADDLFADLPDLPNSSFAVGRLATGGGTSARLPEPKASDLLDLGTTYSRRPPLGTEGAAYPPGRSATSPWLESDPLDGAGFDMSDGETAFLDPLRDLPPQRGKAESASRAALLPPAEPPDFLDMGSFEPRDPQEDTNPTYADGSDIASDADELLDPSVDLGESIAFTIPEGAAASGSAPFQGSPASSLHATPLLDAQPLPDLDPIDLEPLEADPCDVTLRAQVPSTSEPAAPSPAPEPELAPSPPAPTIPATASPERASEADALHAALEKLAWDAFGSLSQELVEQFTRRVEAILWEVVPALAERMVREEIARLKGES